MQRHHGADRKKHQWNDHQRRRDVLRTAAGGGAEPVRLYDLFGSGSKGKAEHAPEREGKGRGIQSL